MILKSTLFYFYKTVDISNGNIFKIFKLFTVYIIHIFLLENDKKKKSYSNQRLYTFQSKIPMFSSYREHLKFRREGGGQFLGFKIVI